MTGAVLAVLLLAVAAAPAEAGFRYVPPVADGGAGEAGGKTDAVSTAPEAGHADPAPGPGPTVLDPGASVWRVHAGETLRAALSRWGERAGADVIFLTDRRYRIDAAAAFEGGFRDAAAALLLRLAHLPHPPEGALSTDGGSLAVTHRRARRDGRNEP